MKEEYLQDNRVIGMKIFWIKNRELLNESLTNSFKFGKLDFYDWMAHCKTLFYLYIKACNYLGWRRDTPEVEIIKHYVPELANVIHRLKGLKVTNKKTKRKYVLDWPDWHLWSMEETRKHWAVMQAIQQLNTPYITPEPNYSNREVSWYDSRWRIVSTPESSDDESELTDDDDDDSDATDIVTSIQY